MAPRSAWCKVFTLRICCILIKPIYQVNNYRECVFENRYFLSIKCVTSKFHFLLGADFLFHLSVKFQREQWHVRPTEAKQSKKKKWNFLSFKCHNVSPGNYKGLKKRKENAVKRGFADGVWRCCRSWDFEPGIVEMSTGFCVYYLCSQFRHSSGQRKQKNEKNRKWVIKKKLFL